MEFTKQQELATDEGTIETQNQKIRDLLPWTEVERDSDGDAKCPSCTHLNEGVEKGKMFCFECSKRLMIV